MRNQIFEALSGLPRRARIPGDRRNASSGGPVSRPASKAAIMLFGIMVLICQTAWADPLDMTRTGLPHSHHIDGQGARQTPRPAALKLSGSRDADPSKIEAGFDVLSDAGAVLSPEALRVSQIADRNGDRHYLMIDKVHGKLILFENGRPTFIRSALTGESMADQFPPDAVSKSVYEHIGVKYKVTPAGRFTLTRAHDDALGETFDINEIQGKDWSVAIHQVWLGNRSEHRDARLRSLNDQDKHITTGCIDVDPGTIKQLLRLLPNDNGTPIYILPIDESSIARLFGPRDNSASRTPTPLPNRHGPA